MTKTTLSQPNMIIAAATVLGSAVLAWFFARSSQKAPVPVRSARPKNLDDVDQASYDSFPASDPPARY